VFEDVTTDAGLSGFVVFRGDRTSQLPEDMGPGVAWGDFDNDGDDDLFLVSAGGPVGSAPADRAASELYENMGDRRFRRVADFPETRVLGTGAAWADVDADGWLDLVVSGYEALLLFRNREGRLSVDTTFTAPPGFWTAVTWGDYDRDGDPDLYVCGYVQYRAEPADRARSSTQYGAAVPFTLNPASYPPERNLLFRNDGRGGFREVAAALAVDNPDGRSLGAVWHDFDGDGWLDLYVANDISDNVMFHNRRGRFVDISHAAWVADHRGAMGLAVGDWNRDGDDDIFVSHWVAQENALYESLLADGGRAAARRADEQASGPAAESAGPPPPVRFVDTADSVGLGQISLPMVGWGAEFADVDADGWLDLVVANGSTMETGGPPAQLKPQPQFLFWNQRGRAFHDLAPLSPAFSRPSVARGLAVADFDRDGDVDVLIMRRDAGVQLLENRTSHGRWIQVRLRNRLPGRAGVYGRGFGAQLVASVGEVRLRRAVSPASYLSQSSAVVHFGLGEAAGVDRLEIRWPDGASSTVGPLAADRMWEITEGDPTPREVGMRAPAGVPPADLRLDDRARTMAFWTTQRQAMRALKVDSDLPRAVALLREALVHDPSHEDSRYYLATSLAGLGEVDAALAELDTLRQANAASHRAWARWGVLRALTSRLPVDLQAAETSLERARAVNPEETGALLALADVSILQGDRAEAESRLDQACAMNPRASGGWFLLGYVHWKRGDMRGAVALLQRARASLGPDWKPRGATAEGDVTRQAHEDLTPLSRFVNGWNGSERPGEAYAELDRFLGR
jgi:Tfp pilus assembly protein PilF